MLCDAVTSLPVNFEIYPGKSNDDLSVNKVDNLVQQLVKDVEEKFHVVYMDRYFMAPGIANKLFEKGIYSVGTVKSNRKELPDLLRGKKLKKGEHVAFRFGPVLAVKWKDTRYVIMCSTVHKDDTIVTKSRGQREKTKPVCVAEYNKFKCGVD